MYEEYFGLIESPFSLTPDPKFFYQGETHLRAYEVLRYSIHRGEGFMLVYGDIGTGKTTLCRMLLDNLEENVYAALLTNPFLSEMDLLRAILQDFGVASSKSWQGKELTKHDLITILNEFLLSVLAVGGRAVIIIDEAQNIPIPTLEQIRIISNLETHKQKLVQIILVGQSEFKEILGRPELRQLRQRISIRCELLPLSNEEVGNYIRHRVAVASNGRASAFFTDDAITTIYDYSAGAPRMINLLCDRSLMAGIARHTNKIDRKVVREAASALEMRKTKPAKVSGHTNSQQAKIVYLVAIILLGLLLTGVLSFFMKNEGIFGFLSSLAP